MPDYKVTESQLTSIANAIRAKVGGGDPIEFPTEFVSKISGITAKITQSYDSITITVGQNGMAFTPHDLYLFDSAYYLPDKCGPLRGVTITPQPSKYSYLQFCTVYYQKKYRFCVFNSYSSTILLQSGTTLRFTFPKYSPSL